MPTPSLLDVKFILLLCTLGLTRTLWPQRHLALIGSIGSALIVGLASPQTLLVVGAIVLLYLYPLHLLMTGRAGRNISPGASSGLLAVGVIGLVVALVLFKVYRHFTVPWLGGPWIQAEVLSLVGFSYFTFRAISFLHLQAITKRRESSPWPILYYCLFPPTITSGPIQKYTDFRQQLDRPLPLSASLFGAAGYRILRGCFRKLVLASILSVIIERLLLQDQTVVVSSACIALLYLYFYFDFAGYSDMAIGYGQLMGFRVPENFRQPFLATTASEFWRNWHITLVDWFRDQVFVPLGGMKSRTRAGAVAFLIMVLCGLWHGLTLSLLAWGIWHGLLLLAEAWSGAKPMPPSLRHGPRFWGRVAWTNARVAVASILFLPDPAATLRILAGLGHWRLP